MLCLNSQQILSMEQSWRLTSVLLLEVLQERSRPHSVSCDAVRRSSILASMAFIACGVMPLQCQFRTEWKAAKPSHPPSNLIRKTTADGAMPGQRRQMLGPCLLRLRPYLPDMRLQGP